MERRLTFASLFSGIGMADLAARWCGWDHAFWCEIDPFCQQVMRYHFKDSKGYGDITESYFGKWRGKIDVLHTSFPCVSISLAGKRRGDSDDRYLWPDSFRVIREVRPNWVTVENVANLAKVVSSVPRVEVEGGEHVSVQENLLHGIVRGLEDEGYSVQSFVIPACAVGAPHRRDRVWVVAHLDSADPGDAGLQEAGPEQQATGIAGDGSRRIVADTEGEGLEGVRDGHEEREPRLEEQGQPDGGSGEDGDVHEWDSSNPQSEQGDRIGFKQREVGQQEQEEYRGDDSQGGDELPYDRFWRSFPTQSPVLRGDDGYPFGLAGCSIPVNKWRKEAIKAVGNALVPQVIYEIYRAIDMVERCQG